MCQMPNEVEAFRLHSSELKAVLLYHTAKPLVRFLTAGARRRRGIEILDSVAPVRDQPSWQSRSRGKSCCTLLRKPARVRTTPLQNWWTGARPSGAQFHMCQMPYEVVAAGLYSGLERKRCRRSLTLALPLHTKISRLTGC